MVKIFVGVTHRPWFNYLAGFGPDEVNFWQPSGSGEFKALTPGDLFLFKLKGRDGAIAGGGVFSHASLAPLSLAWEAFGDKNGNPTLLDMRETIAALRREKTPLGPREDPVIGCRILTEPFFWPPESWIPVPDSFLPQTVVGKGYVTDTSEGRQLWEAVQARLTDVPGAPAPESGDRYGAPTLMRRRLGQGAFRLAVTDGYGRRCQARRHCQFSMRRISEVMRTVGSTRSRMGCCFVPTFTACSISAMSPSPNSAPSR